MKNDELISFFLEDRKSVKEKGSRGNSTSARVDYYHKIANTPDYAVDVYDNGGVAKTITPTADLINGISKDAAAAMKLDSASAKELADNLQISRSTAAAMAQFSDVANIEYLSSGRKMNMPSTKPEHGRLAIQFEEVPGKTVEPKKIVQDESGKYVQVSTGTKKTTEDTVKLKGFGKPFARQVKIEKI